MFKQIYEEEFGTFGGAPFGALIGDYEFGRAPQDVAMLEKISNVAAAAHAPFFAAADPRSSISTPLPTSACRATSPKSSIPSNTPSTNRSATPRTRASSA